MIVNDMRIVDHQVPAVTRGKKYRLGIGATVTTVIVCADGHAAPVRRLRKPVVAIDMLAESVE